VRICIIGKFPPIQGGVSMRTYWCAHALAACGHEVHVVTNAKEAVAPFRMYMRAEDWRRCEATYGTGSVTAHWTEPADHSQSYIPMASPFVTKLAAIAARAHSHHPFDLIYSHYLEPYGVAGHLTSQMTGVPHVVRLAGSDAGRLWHHPQFEATYDYVLGSAAIVIAVGAVAERAIDHGVAPYRIAEGGGFNVPEDLFSPDGHRLDVAALRSEVAQDPKFAGLLWGNVASDRPYFGVYGKLGERKGSFALLAAMQRLKHAGVEVGLVALAHAEPAAEQTFRARAAELGLADRIMQIPFLPHWRVPEFLRGCLAVCCLEQDFPIQAHAPIIPREVLMSGTCLVGSTEVIRKLPSFERLPHGYGCVEVEDVNNVELLTNQLAAVAGDPETAAAVGRRGRDFARNIQRSIPFPQLLERILDSAAARRQPSLPVRRSATHEVTSTRNSRFPLTRLVMAALAETSGNSDSEMTAVVTDDSADLTWARRVLDALERRPSDSHPRFQSMALAVRTEIAVALAEDEADRTSAESSDPFFRLRLNRWALRDGMLAELVPTRDPQLHIIEFDYDVRGFLGAQSIAEFPIAVTRRCSHIVVFARCNGLRAEPLLVDELTARMLQLSDGTRTVLQIAEELGGETSGRDDQIRWIEHLFLLGLLSLQDPGFALKGNERKHSFEKTSELTKSLD